MSKIVSFKKAPKITLFKVPKNTKKTHFFKKIEKIKKIYKKIKKIWKNPKKSKNGVQKGGPKRPRPGGSKRGQKSLFLTIPRHMGGAKCVFGVFEGFWENGQNWPKSRKAGKNQKNIKKFIKKRKDQKNVKK